MRQPTSNRAFLLKSSDNPCDYNPKLTKSNYITSIWKAKTDLISEFQTRTTLNSWKPKLKLEIKPKITRKNMNKIKPQIQPAMTITNLNQNLEEHNKP